MRIIDPAVETWTAALDLRKPRRRRHGRITQRNFARCLNPTSPLLCDVVCPACVPDLYTAAGARHRSDR